MKHLNTYKNESFNMKPMSSYITEYIIKKKLDKPIDSENYYKYYPEKKDELIKIIHMLLDKGETNLNYINTSAITDMSHLFNSNYTKIVIPDNIDISGCDVSNVTNMESMFFDCKNFNCDLSDWNVSNVENMMGMFSECVKFNCDISNWNVSKVVNMNYMFQDCENFDCDLSKWDVSNVLNMICMFSHCKNFKGKGLENWNISKVKTMGGNMMNMLDGCKSIIKKPKWYRFKIK